MISPGGCELSGREQVVYAASKVPAATLTFWVLKLIATTVGEIAGNLVSMSWLGETTARAGQEGVNGYFVGTAMFGLALLTRFNKWIYWATIVASTTFGTTLADFATRSLGIGYTGGSLLLLGLVLLSLFMWKVDAGRISADIITSRKSEVHYWVTRTGLPPNPVGPGRFDALTIINNTLLALRPGIPEANPKLHRRSPKSKTPAPLGGTGAWCLE